MIYKNKFNLTGTDVQQAIVKEALDKIMFPWERIHLPGEPVEIGWMDLNNGMFAINIEPPAKSIKLEYEYAYPTEVTDDTDIHRIHGTHEHPEGDKPEPLVGRLHGRLYILGVFYPGTGRIYIDNALANHPEMAQATVSAEIAHSVDEFLPLSDSQRDAIMKLMHGGGTDEHTWWEKVDYGAEYWSLVGESFMQAFTIAYSDMPFGNTADFVHSLKPEQIPDLRKIVGIERTDAEPAPMPHVPAPTEVVEYETFPPSKVYHRLSHYDSPNRVGVLITDTTGYRPCKKCKP